MHNVWTVHTRFITVKIVSQSQQMRAKKKKKKAENVDAEPKRSINYWWFGLVRSGSVDKHWEKSIIVGYMECNILLCAIIWHLIIDSSDWDRKCPISSSKIKLCVFYLDKHSPTHTDAQKLSSVVKNLIISSHVLSIFLVRFGKKSYKNSVTS